MTQSSSVWLPGTWADGFWPPEAQGCSLPSGHLTPGSFCLILTLVRSPRGPFVLVGVAPTLPVSCVLLWVTHRVLRLMDVRKFSSGLLQTAVQMFLCCRAYLGVKSRAPGRPKSLAPSPARTALHRHPGPALSQRVPSLSLSFLVCISRPLRI